MKYILIAWLGSYSGGNIPFVAYFSDRVSCESAIGVLKSRTNQISGVCVPDSKGV